jgi:hypothetical protein
MFALLPQGFRESQRDATKRYGGSNNDEPKSPPRDARVEADAAFR